MFRPVIFVRNSNDNYNFYSSCTRERLLEDYGEHEIILSSANSYSYSKTRVTLRHYIENMMSKPQDLKVDGANTFYHFGDNDYESFKPLFDMYEIPFERPGTISWGLAAGSTGVPFHTHGPVFAEVIYGRKVSRILF